jgi:DNA polymerase
MLTKLEELELEYSNCTLCTLCNQCQTCILLKERPRHVVFGEGNPHADIMIIGEAPGRLESETGKPYQGAAGVLINTFIDNVFLDRYKDIYITNTVCCRPTMEVINDRTKEKCIGNRPPTKKELLACRPRLLETIYLVDPLLIITIGKIPLTTLCGKKSISMPAIRGQMQTLLLPGRHIKIRYSVFPMYSAPFLLKTQDNRPEGPWGRTQFDWVKVCHIIDYLRNVYYGIPQPNREDMANDRRIEIDNGEKSSRKVSKKRRRTE